MLHTPSLEAGLQYLLDALLGNQSAGGALWIWPEPGLVAIGMIGTARLYEIQHQPILDPPTASQLRAWSVPGVQTGGDSARVYYLGDYGAISNSDPRSSLTMEDREWYGLWLNWLATREQTLREAKMRALAEFAGGAGHEINNPLGTILGRSQLLQRQETDPDRHRGLVTIANQALRIRDMIADTMTFARPPMPQCQWVDVIPLIDEVLYRLQPELDRGSVQLRRQLASTISVMLDRDQFQVAILELLRNAIQVTGAGGKIGLRVRTRAWGGRDWCEIDLLNHGPALTAVEREHLFDPFFSGRNAGRGLGFGLTKCWRILESHGGRIGVDSTSERTVFRSLWPLDAPSSARISR
ncbi:MAG: sensor histidine kinase [Planctomycetota bacterium]|nr:MAG: sensor histidine kinase [Planctomycetota bacterium]